MTNGILPLLREECYMFVLASYTDAWMKWLVLDEYATQDDELDIQKGFTIAKTCLNDIDLDGVCIY